ncbi:hypothetical protein GCM10025777_29780 [Membranihabitans marinus]
MNLSSISVMGIKYCGQIFSENAYGYMAILIKLRLLEISIFATEYKFGVLLVVLLLDFSF